MEKRSGYTRSVPVIIILTLIGFAIAAVVTVTIAMWLAERLEWRERPLIIIALVISAISALMTLLKKTIEEESIYVGAQGNGRKIIIDHAFKNQIMKIYSQYGKTDGLFMFEQIPQQRLQNAIASFAPSCSSDETLILLYDNTPDGTCKDGILLTSKRLYCRDGNSNRVAPISSISELIGSYSLASAEITVILHSKKTNINIKVSKARTSARALFNLLCNSIWPMKSKY